MSRTVDATPSTRLIPREGLYLSPLLHIFRKLFLNPLLTAPVAAALQAPGSAALSSFSAAISSLSFESIASALKNISVSSLLESLRAATRSSPSTAALIAKILVVAGCAYHTNKYLSFWARNNWVKDEYDWANEIVLVTGGANKTGFGGLVAQDLMRRGIRVVVLDIEGLKYQTNELVTYYKCNLGDAEDIKAVAARIKKEVGDPTVIVNNAGISREIPITTGTHDDVSLTFAVNTVAQFSILREFLPAMIRRNHGHIVSTSSASAFVPPWLILDYGASKAALVNLHEGLQSALAYDLKASRIRTTIVVPCYARTPMFTGKTDKPWFLLPVLDPETVSDAIVNQILSGYGEDQHLPGFIGVVPYIKMLPYWIQKPLLYSKLEKNVDLEER